MYVRQQTTNQNKVDGIQKKNNIMEEFDSFVLYHEMKKHTEVSQKRIKILS
jgi:hypothetical protein